MRTLPPTGDPVQDLVRALPAEVFVDWLIEYHGLPETARSVVESNLRTNFRWHRLQGRLDNRPAIATLAEVWQLRQHVRSLETKTGE